MLKITFRHIAIVAVKVVLKAYDNNKYNILPCEATDFDDKIANMFNVLATLATKFGVRHYFGKSQK